MSNQSGRTARMAAVPARLDDTIRDAPRPRSPSERECMMFSPDEALAMWPDRPTLRDVPARTLRVPCAPPPYVMQPERRMQPAPGRARSVEPMKRVLYLSPSKAVAVRQRVLAAQRQKRSSAYLPVAALIALFVLATIAIQLLRVLRS